MVGEKEIKAFLFQYNWFEMVLIRRKDKEHSFILPDKQAERLGLDKGKEYELQRVKDGFFVLFEKTAKKTQKTVKKEVKEKPKEEKKEKPVKKPALDEKILSKLESKKLSDRVEGKFEGFLSKGEKKRFKELIKEGKIVPFKLSEKYKKAIYKTREELEESRAQKKTKGALKPIEVSGEEESSEKKPEEAHYSLERDNFTVVSSEEEAKRLSYKLKDQIKNKEVLGTKSFDGNYFVIKSDLYEKYSPKVLNLIKNNSPAKLSELIESLDLNEELVKAVCEFLKEEGKITEKRKELYEFIP